MERILEIIKQTDLCKPEDMARSLGRITAIAELELIKEKEDAVRNRKSR